MGDVQVSGNVGVGEELGEWKWRVVRRARVCVLLSSTRLDTREMFRSPSSRAECPMLMRVYSYSYRLESEKGDWPALYTNLHAAISARDPEVLLTKPEQAAEVIRLIELGMQSSREGRVLAVSKA